jgi:hypothetical protein
MEFVLFDPHRLQIVNTNSLIRQESTLHVQSRFTFHCDIVPECQVSNMIRVPSKYWDSIIISKEITRLFL